MRKVCYNNWHWYGWYLWWHHHRHHYHDHRHWNFDLSRFFRWDRLFQAVSLYPFFLNTWESSNFKRFSSLQEEAKPELKEQLDEVGFIYYLILARLEDLKPRKPDGKIIHQKKINPVVSKRQIHVQWLVYNSNLSWEMVKESTIGNNNKPHLMARGSGTNPFLDEK